ILINSTTAFTSEGTSYASEPGRGLIEIKKVVAISGNQVTISPGLHMPNWRSSQSPRAWWGDDTVHGDGVEDLSIDNSGSATTSVHFQNAMNCWVRGVRSMTPYRSHVWLMSSSHITVRDSYFYGTVNSASQSYGVEAFPTSDSLVENNMMQHVTSPVMLNG